MKKRFLTIKKYDIHWYCGTHCYRTTSNCTFEQVQESRKIAKVIGDTIKYEYSHTEKIEYYG